MNRKVFTGEAYHNIIEICFMRVEQVFFQSFFARPLNLAAMFFCAPAQKHKIGNAGSQSGFFGLMNLRKEEKLSTFMN